MKHVGVVVLKLRSVSNVAPAFAESDTDASQQDDQHDGRTT